ncbi:Unconventional myosin-XVIIIa [Bagarius yarrelli]|uniref:Unconventional myosin-XVIIIa n=1 Tax=Bagarius yarrelli TaxID=175774 RepID=A0A556U3H3_BAGYA|nr:Unconventional myosin-XVIIIa [Bagarius yarrelli]
MFNLIKKDKEKDGGRKEKKEKKDKKERMSQAELKSLEEVGVQRGFFNLQRGASKRESRTKLEISDPIPIQVVSNPELTLVDLNPQRINNRGSMLLDVRRISTSISSDNIKAETMQDVQKSSFREQASKPGSLTKQSSPVVKLIKRLSFSQKNKEESPSEGSVPSGPNSAASSPQVESKVLHVPTYISHRRAPLKKIHIPLLVDKMFPADLRLPAVIPPKLRELRELELQRRSTGDFGFSLRRTYMLDQKPDGSVYRRVVHFAEPGAGNKDVALGLVPGDRLVEINGMNVENKNRDEIVEMIRQSGETVNLKVQPIVELSELSRCWLRNIAGVRGEPSESPSLVDGGGGGDNRDLPASRMVSDPLAEPRSNSSVSGASQARRVVSRVKEEPPPPTPVPNKLASTATSVPKSSKPPTLASHDDDISAGLTSLMGRGRTKEHRARSRAGKEVKESKENSKPVEETKPEVPDKTCPSSPAPVPNKSDITPNVACTASPKPDPVNVSTESIPKAKPDPLASPPCLSPAPKSTPSAPLHCLSPPPKQDPLAPPVGFVPAPKRDPFAPVAGFIPRAKVDPLAPPAGFIPAQRPTAVRKPEVTAKLVVDPVALLQASHSAALLSKVKTEEQIAAEQAWFGTEKVWLLHKDGFSLATQLKTEEGSVPEGKVKLRLEHDGTLLEVDEDDVEKANPPSLDRVEDLSSLLYLNESSVMHALRQRYGGNLIHTYAGPNIVVINPASALSMYSEKVMHMFKGCRREDTAPHIYGVAQSAYRKLLTTRQDQSIVLLGKSGSGKTNNCQHLVQYLVTIAGSNSKVYSAEKWQAVYTILEAFGNCSTSMNGNASRFSHIVSLDFDQAGQVASASIQTMLLEKSRVTRRPDGESAFNVFYYMMAGAEGSFKFQDSIFCNLYVVPTQNRAALQPLCRKQRLRDSAPFQGKSHEKQKATQQFAKLQAAMKVLSISPDEQRTVWLVLGAIYHLGAAGATKAGRKQFARHEWAQKAAYLLGCSLEELSSSIFKPQGKGTLPRTSSVRPADEDSGDSSGKQEHEQNHSLIQRYQQNQAEKI